MLLEIREPRLILKLVSNWNKTKKITGLVYIEMSFPKE
jgi:hypothetical protein